MRLLGSFRTSRRAHVLASLYVCTALPRAAPLPSLGRSSAGLPDGRASLSCPRSARTRCLILAIALPHRSLALRRRPSRSRSARMSRTQVANARSFSRSRRKYTSLVTLVGRVSRLRIIQK